MKVIDVLNKIANGEINEDTLIEFDNGYKDYCSVRVFFDRYIMDRENLNCEVKVIEEDKKIEKLDIYNCFEQLGDSLLAKERLDYNFNAISDKINEILYKINKEK